MSLGVANPAGAAALIAIVILVALWLWERRRRVVPVGTLFLWQRVAPSPLERRRLQPDLLFLLQLLALLALCGAYVEPYLEAPPVPRAARTAIVLDVSASMQVREANGETRFAAVRTRARTLLAGMGDGSEVMLITAAARARVALRWTAERARATEALDGLAPVDTPTNLAPALELALTEARAVPATRVVVLTDLPPAASGLAAETAAGLDWMQVGRTDDNVGIAGLTVEPVAFGSLHDALATVLVRNYGHAPRTVVVEARVDGEPWARHVLTLAPRATEPLVLHDPPRAGRLEVALGADDALAVDDRALGWIGAEVPLDAVLVTESQALGAAFEGVAAAAGGRVEVVNRARWEEEPVRGRRVAVFDGFVPAASPAGNALYVAPPAGNPTCPAEAAVDGATVVDWDATHPLLAGLDDLEAMPIGRAVRLATPAWGVAVVLAAARGAAFPLLVTGERDGRRVACLASELTAPLVSSDRLPLLLLVVATLRWLGEPPAAAPLVVDTGVAAPAGVAPATASGGIVIAGDPPVVLAERAGAYRAGDRVVLANLADERESDVGRDGPRDRAATARPVPARAIGSRRELAWWLLAVAWLVLAAEWLVWRRREAA